MVVGKAVKFTVIVPLIAFAVTIYIISVRWNAFCLNEYHNHIRLPVRKVQAGVPLKIEDLLKKQQPRRRPQVETDNFIPKVIYQTYKLPNAIPAKVAANFAKFAPDYKRYVLGDDDCIAFLTNHFNPEVVSTFNALRGAHKADLFRYAILYINGGVYLDIKTELIMPLDQLIDHNNTRRTTYTVIDHQNIWIYQGVLASPKGNPLFLHGILKFVHAEKPIDYYFISVEQIYQVISIDTNQTHLKQGFNKGSDGEYSRLDINLYNDSILPQSNFSHDVHALPTMKHKPFDYYLFKENKVADRQCKDGLDRYGGCYYIFSGDRQVIKSRYADYPFDVPVPAYKRILRPIMKYYDWRLWDIVEQEKHVCKVMGWRWPA